MKQQKHQTLDLRAAFPWRQYPRMLPKQREAIDLLGRIGGSATLELPTGSGKTAIGYTFLKAMANAGAGPLFYVTPTKTLVEQVKRLHPDVTIAYGRSEHPCLYYEEDFKADEIPCSLLADCPHRVDQETGETFDPDEEACPYLAQKYQAKQSRIVVCTTAFYLYTQLFSKEWAKPAGLVIDEVHKLARIVRSALSYEVTDYHLRRSIELLDRIGASEAEPLERFLKVMVGIIRKKPASRSTLLEAHEVRELMDILLGLQPEALLGKLGQAIKGRAIDPVEQREVLKQIETLAFDLRRYVRSFEYSLPTGSRHPLNYTYAFYREEREKGERAQYRLFIKAYYVAPIIKRLLSPFTVSYSATIGDPQILGYETGIEAPFSAFDSDFPVSNTRVFLPKDTPNLAMKERSRGEPTKVLRKIAKAAHRLKRAGLRSLVVVVSEKERQKFLELCEEERVKAISYGNGMAAKDVASRFKAGEGDALVGTVAQYGEGVDLPKSLAPVIFFLRPAFPVPTDPATVFEERRFGTMRWQLWNWRVMIEALQVRGRNIRGSGDVGVTIFVSQQFRRFIPAVLPVWLRAAYDGHSTLEGCVEKTIHLCAKPEEAKALLET